MIVVAAKRPPNFIFILSDDIAQGDLGCYGQKLSRATMVPRFLPPPASASVSTRRLTDCETGIDHPLVVPEG
jgi:arylsulfatase A-like enzyme